MCTTDNVFLNNDVFTTELNKSVDLVMCVSWLSVVITLDSTNCNRKL